MSTISIEDKWIDTVQLFGEVEQVVQEALRTYLIEQCQQRLDRASARIAIYQKKYGCSYDKFRQLIQTDEKFLAKVETQTPLWEEEAMEWEYWLEEQRTWRSRLNTILQR